MYFKNYIVYLVNKKNYVFLAQTLCILKSSFLKTYFDFLKALCNLEHSDAICPLV